jgi:hypothetical protein
MMEILKSRPGQRNKPNISIILSCPNKVHIGKLVAQMTNEEKDMVEFICPEKEVENIPKAYNEMIPEADSGCIVFLNNNVIPTIDGWLQMIIDSLNKYDMVGAIGTSWISTHAPLWNVVRSDRIYGTIIVMPSSKGGKPVMFKYEKPPAQAVCLEGSLMAIRNPSVLRFDEYLNSFYDIELSMRHHLEHHKVWVLPIPIQSDSLFVSLNSKSNASLIMFRNKWCDKFPYIKIEEE